MKTYYPSYYNDFSCIADKCPDSCCKKWEIVIDNDTLSKYKNINGSFGEFIRSQITKNEEGECCFRLSGKNCPFLNGDGLCDIHIKLGEDYTSEICRNHPRFIEEYDGFTEISLSLSCPEANRIILSSENSIYPRPEYTGDDEVLELLIGSREKLLSARADFTALADLLLDSAADDSLDIDLVYIENHPDLSVSFFKDLARFILENSEILTDQWKRYLKNTVNSDTSDDEFRSFCKENDASLIKLYRYYIYRYYLKAVNDLDIYSRGLFILSAVMLSALISFTCDVHLSESARLFSKETEHNLFNIDLMLEYFSNF